MALKGSGAFTTYTELEWPTATTTTVGGIKVGTNLSIAADGTLSSTGGSGSLPDGVEGNILYHDGSEWATLEPGTSSQFLKGGTTPSWDTPGGSGDVIGPSSTTENYIPQWDSTTKTLKDGKAIGTTEGTIAAGDDSRFTDARTPTNHNLIDTTGHPVSGLTEGHFIKATGATTYEFATHGLTASDVEAMPVIEGVQGNVLYYNGSAWATLAPSTAGYVLSTNGEGQNPSWASAATSKAVGTDIITGTDDVKYITSKAIKDAGPKRSIFLSLAGGWTGTTLPDGGFLTTETSTNKVNFRGTKMAASADDAKHEFGCIMPGNWNAGTITAKAVFFVPTSTDASDHTIILGLQGVSFADGDAGDTAYGTAQEVTETVSSSIAGKVIITSESSAITIGNTPAAGEWVQFRTYRKGSDTYTGDITLLGWIINYTTNAYSDA